MGRSVGSGTGPTTLAPVRVTCSTMSRAATSSIRWSYARSLIRIFGPATASSPRRSFFDYSCCLALLQDLGDPAGPDGAAAFADREPEAFLHRDRLVELYPHLHVVAGHHHLHPFGQMRDAGHVRGAEVELRLVPVEEGRVPAPLLLGQDVNVRHELGVRRDGPRLREDLSTLHVLLVATAEEHTDIVAGLDLVQELAEHLEVGRDRLPRLPQAD